MHRSSRCMEERKYQRQRLRMSMCVTAFPTCIASLACRLQNNSNVRRRVVNDIPRKPSRVVAASCEKVTVSTIASY
ncbi:uncharacterized protein LAESUDRAFT_514397 [Laetiporus sulphureus 93-53]|uniref:Uncharacterized protein n=1 Tax=Laetiporus sulphureus 93-53 TaxID=1314785 RepID=A0A165FZS0_9APHY|nr:uncharacterized protein LAESUDRAFT_514397 [Laetiporus sulphureus 93-53]KZT09634.1 hypothetical protein LAESUDRAFT_514397 [Laetiporus sulphureus 93-53]